jgi:putative FmdB family regulatory protein
VPLYEYECTENGHRFELIRKFSDPEVRTCIKCKSKVKRLLSAPAISFKGSGWYITDYSRKSSGTNGSGGGKESGSTKSTDKPDSKSKPDAKPSSKSKD